MPIHLEFHTGHRKVWGCIDSMADINVIAQRTVVTLDLERHRVADAELPDSRLVGAERSYCYGAYDIPWTATDSWSSKRTCTSRFYALDCEEHDILIGWPAGRQQGIVVDMGAEQWRYGIARERCQIDSPRAFVKALRRRSVVYALVLAKVGASTNDVSRHDAGGIPIQLRGFEDVFSKEEAGKLPPLKAGDHAIDVNADPPYGPIYNLSHNELAELRRYIDDMLARGWIRHSTSPAGAPILFVPKKDGGLRLCVDYRGLNKVTIKNRHPLPLITETLDRLNGAKKFSKMDLKEAYHRIRIKEGDEWKTAFRTRYGHFEYLVMPFGLANAPATFQAYINRALAGLVDVFVVVYLDDILVYSNSEEEHWNHVRQVLERLRQHRLYVNLSKCAFDVEQLEFLGFIVSINGVSMDPDRVKTITEWPHPKSYRDVQVFLGFANFYRRFIEKYSTIAAPLTDLLKGSKEGRKSGPLEWKPEADEAFNRLRNAFTTAPLLAHFQPEQKIRVETDASGYGIAGIMSQPNANGVYHPVAFWSRKMQAAEQNYETHDAELLAIVKVFEQWRHYLEGAQHTIEVLSDHDNLRGFMHVKELNARQRRWVMKLAAYDFEIFHRAGKLNPADAPSRRPDYQGEAPDRITMLPTLRNKLGLCAKISSAPAAVLRIRVRYLRKGRKRNRRPRKPPTERDNSDGIDVDPSFRQNRDTSPTESRQMAMPSVDRRDADGGPTEPGVEMNPVAGMTGCKQLIPRSAARDAAADETAHGDPSESVAELICWAQQNDDFTATRLKWVDKEKRSRKAGLWSKNEQGLLLFKSSIYVPEDVALRKELLSKHHDDPFAGHFGVEKTLELIKRHYSWPGLAKEVAEYVKTCDICQRVKVHRHKPYGMLGSLPQPNGPWQEISVDFITGLPYSRHRRNIYDSVLVVVDRFTKMARYIPTLKSLKAVEFADLFVEEIVGRFGTPNGIVSDRGSVFTSAFWSEFCYHLKIKRRLSTAFHPQTDGQTERQNQHLEHYLRVYSNWEQSNWAALLFLAEFAYNNSVHSVTGFTPFFMLYGFHPKIFFRAEDSSIKGRVPAANQRIQNLHVARQRYSELAKKAHEEQAKYYNKAHIPMTYKIGDLVLLSTKNLRVKRPSKKLSERFAGPFRVEEIVGSQAYKLTLPTASRLSPVFHVSLLELYHGRGDGSQVEFALPELIDDVEEWEVEEILEREDNKDGQWYLVKWVDWPEEYNQWVEASDLTHARDLKRKFDETKESRAVGRGKRRRT